MAPNKADGIIYRQKGNEYYADVEWLSNKTVYVKRFGAVGDGVTNDAAAIRRMISFLPASDFSVVFEMQLIYKVTELMKGMDLKRVFISCRVMVSE